MSSPLDICDCSVWCNRHRDCLMLELCLHSCSAMNWVSGLRFSIPYLTGRFPCRSPLLISPFQVRPTSRSDYRTGAIGLLGFYRFIAFIVIGPLGLWTFIVYGISYFGFSVYVVPYVSDFILYYGIHAWMWTFKYLYMDISDICIYRSIFTISKVTGVTFWYQSGFRPGSDPGWRFWRPWFIRFKRF